MPPRSVLPVRVQRRLAAEVVNHEANPLPGIAFAAEATEDDSLWWVQFTHPGSPTQLRQLRFGIHFLKPAHLLRPPSRTRSAFHANVQLLDGAHA